MRTWIAALVALGLMVLLAPFGGARTAEANVSGKWHFVLQTEGGERTSDPVFQQDGEKVTGKWADADVKGTFADGKLILEFPLNSEEAGPGTLKIKGQLAEDGSLAGDWAFQDYTGSFKATKVKDEEAPRPSHGPN